MCDRLGPRDEAVNHDLRLARWLVALGLFVAACTGSVGATPEGTPEEDGGGAGGSSEPDPAAPPAEPAAEGGAPIEAGAEAASGNDAILGTLSGPCGVVDALLGAPSPSLSQSTLSFVAGESFDKPSLSLGGQRIFDTPNAGGSSVESEIMSFEVLHHCDGAKLLKTETEIEYLPPDGNGPPSITDILVEIGGKKVGVSVTRAYKPPSQTLSDADVKTLLEKKLEGVNRSSERVKPADKWVKQILHVFAATKDAADAVVRVLPQISATLRADTIVLLTRTVGGGFVYCNPDPPLGSECL